MDVRKLQQAKDKDQRYMTNEYLPAAVRQIKKREKIREKIYSAKYFGGCFIKQEPVPHDQLPDVSNEQDTDMQPVF